MVISVLNLNSSNPHSCLVSEESLTQKSGVITRRDFFPWDIPDRLDTEKTFIDVSFFSF